MAKEFNDIGTCIPARHYMVDTSHKIKGIIELVEKGKYFTLNRPRQFGKTTTISLLYKILLNDSNYFVIKTSFEGIGDTMFESEQAFAAPFAEIIAETVGRRDQATSTLIRNLSTQVVDLKTLSLAITEWVKKINKKMVLLIDEVDKSSNNQLFLSFLGMLRNKYLLANDGEDYTFHSVVLAGVHDVKTLKMKISPDSTGKLNSPWNIAADFIIDMSFNPAEISTMLADYSNDKNIEMDIPAIADRLYYYTSGYPYLVSKMCKVIDEILIPEKRAEKWNLEAIDTSFRYLINKAYTTTLFDDMIKNLENNSLLYDFVFEVLMGSKSFTYDVDNPEINLAAVYGIIGMEKNLVKIHNLIFEQRLSLYMASKLTTSQTYYIPNSDPEYFNDHNLDIQTIFLRFRTFMRENYSQRDEKFIEREGRLLFLAFLKPILNGKGYEFKEPVVGDERRMDIVIVYENKRYVIELKRWYGEKSHKKGLQQLSDYLDIFSLKKGYLLIYDFRKEKDYREETIQFKDKEIFAVWV